VQKVNNTARFAMVITHLGLEGRLIDMPWLEAAYQIDASDWLVLSPQDWRATVAGEATIWQSMERKLLIGFYLNEPEVIAVIGHASGRAGPEPAEEGQQEVRRIMRRVNSLLLPTVTAGFWSDDDGWLMDTVESEESTVKEPAV
jgi:hypothetical protein